jgi:hypothetical protein
MAEDDLRSRLNGAQKNSDDQAESTYRDLILGDHPNDAESIKVKEEAVLKLCSLKVAQSDAEGLRTLLTELRPLFVKFPKAKTAKIVRNIIDAIVKIPNSTDLQVIQPHMCHCIAMDRQIARTLRSQMYGLNRLVSMTSLIQLSIILFPKPGGIRNLFNYHEG